ncbi:HAEPLYID family protein [Belliella kenyensis]|uniref:HAEPLYID family protein n=1 Tax=Belliella kenyensis TaxID=1472724 RepID=A0ABV8ENR9_9BACT|nr:HAEPLYID family protein [Belliella kenyensis]MCH7401978.1 phosphoribosylformylglycinamidine synthase [Belliella kenyensis]MDN3605142.1 HAEPLYID family protein [Belliella kenyensis]
MKYTTHYKLWIAYGILCICTAFNTCVFGQEVEQDSIRQERIQLDSIFIAEIEIQTPTQKPKVLHAEPLYIDLIRDLGARKGEKEWNLGMGMTDKRGFDEYEALVEYEWAPIDRLGFEIEVPVTLYSARGDISSRIDRPENRVESLKLATQWSFLVSEKAKTTLALGYIHEFEFVDLNRIGQGEVFKGNIYNPFFVAAKRWGRNYHTLVYTGPRVEKIFNERREISYEVHSNFHYMIPGTRNFIGIEFNKEFHHNEFIGVLRPQMRVGLAENLMVGIVTGIPVSGTEKSMSSFVRIIYEPGFKTFH